ncbi:MAG: asparagine synthase (glutamine-hydrolyzing) [Solirubrobacteraceae bacterium MAG38_C4-C5]|nr:asparagine synthase (glutamine-hydrolyzing) [Candidatus Siliceabacter maunaloa]
MCGIVGQYGMADPALGARMLDRLGHRGPDGSGIARFADAWIGHRRLAIVDPAGGCQPILNEDRSMGLAANAEVYNHEELRRRLASHAMSTRSDNEVIVHLLEQEHPTAIGLLDGMYAFCCAGDDFFVAARDPIGIKPLYWARDGGRVVFASEIGAFDEGWRRHVKVFPPGHYWSASEGLVRFATPAQGGSDGLCSEEEHPPPRVLEQLRDLLVAAVRSHMMGDVPIGILLSGGLDSSLIAAIAARAAAEDGKRLKSFSIGLPGSADLAAARVVAAHVGTDHHECVYTPAELVEALPRAIAALESFEPALVRGAVPNYLLAENVERHVKVVLCGEGADELFAGYEYLCGFDSGLELHHELVSLVEGLHKLDLQRTDRVTMAHGVEARPAFLQRDVVSFALSLPGHWKLSGGGRIEKDLLRRAFDGWLPAPLLWRRKAQFGDGSGASIPLRKAARDLAQVDLETAQRRDPTLRSLEELVYRRIFEENLEGVCPDRLLGRFATA